MRRLASDGPNTFSTLPANPLQQVLANFWAPVPWLLEAAVLVQMVLHEYPQAADVGR